MLQAMRDRAMGVLGWIVIGLIIVTFALFGLGSYLQDSSRVYAAKVNDVEIAPRELQLAYQNQRANMEQMLGDAFDPALIDDQKLKQQALQNLIRRELLLQAARADGMAVSDQLLAARIHAISAFQENGEFNQERYQRLLAQQGQTPAGFEQDTRRLLTVEQLINGVSNTAFVTDAEVDRVYSLQEQKRSFDYMIVAAEPFKAAIQPSDAEIKAYYDQHSDRFVTPQRVRLSYVRLNADVLDKGIEVSDAAVNEYYEQKKASLQTQEQRRASHILFQLAADADEETVNKTRLEAEKVLQQIRDGEDFGKLAKQYSADPGSSAKDGDLGYFAAGMMVPEFDTAVFAMQVGDVSELVRTQFGFHIIKLIDIKGSEIPPLADVRTELVKEIKQRQIDDRFYEQLEQLTDTAYENPDNLQAAADALGLEIKVTDWISESAGDGTDIGKYPQVRAAAFSDDVLESGNNSEPLEVGQNDAIVVRIKDREAAHPTPIEDVKDKIVAALTQEQAAKAARNKGEQLLQKLQEGAATKDLADADGLTYQQADAVGRDAPGHNPELVREVFRLPRPSAQEPVDKGLELDNGDYAVVQLKAVTDADPATMTEAQRTQLKTGYENMWRNQALAILADDLRRQAKVEIAKDSEQ
jgi:peptidyl-prolyl cis-trans isomerase D